MDHPIAEQSIAVTQDAPSKRLGLFGGSFNPVHNGHLAIARDVREHMQLSRILFIPTGDPPHKHNRSLAPAPIRFEMVRLAIADTPVFDVSAMELHRAGKSYSIDTVRELREQYGRSWKLFFIIGLDAFLEFPTWRAPEELLRLCHFVVVPRPGRLFQTLAGTPFLSNLDPEPLRQLDAGVLEKLEIAVPDASGITCLLLPLCPISASDIRQKIRSRLSLANMLPPR